MTLETTVFNELWPFLPKDEEIHKRDLISRLAGQIPREILNRLKLMDFYSVWIDEKGDVRFY